MNFDYTEEQTLLDNMVTSFVRDNYDWDTRCNIVKSEEGWKEENWKQFAELGLLGVPFDEAYGGLGGKSADLIENEDVKEFYLGGGNDKRKSFKNLKSYKRRKRWL